MNGSEMLIRELSRLPKRSHSKRILLVLLTLTYYYVYYIREEWDWQKRSESLKWSTRSEPKRESEVTLSQIYVFKNHTGIALQAKITLSYLLLMYF